MLAMIEQFPNCFSLAHILTVARTLEAVCVCVVVLKRRHIHPIRDDLSVQSCMWRFYTLTANERTSEKNKKVLKIKVDQQYTHRWYGTQMRIWIW